MRRFASGEAGWHVLLPQHPKSSIHQYHSTTEETPHQEAFAKGMTEQSSGEAPEACTLAGAHQQLFEEVDVAPKAMGSVNGHECPLTFGLNPINSLATSTSWQRNPKKYEVWLYVIR